MAAPRLVSLLMCVLAARMALAKLFSLRQGEDFLWARVGEQLRLSCFYKERELWVYWYKQALGREPTIISSFYTLHSNKFTFYGEFEDQRFSLHLGSGSLHLNITDLRDSDSARYYCAAAKLSTFEFAEGATVSVRGSGFVNTQHPQTACAVDPELRDQERGARWFQSSEEPRGQGIVFTHRGSSDRCEYSLPGNVSDGRMELCAVLSCREALFGNTAEEEEPVSRQLDLVCVLGAILAVTVSLSVVLLFVLCVKMRRGIICCCAESPAESSAPPSSATHGAVSGDAGEPHYAALNANVLKRSRASGRVTQTECVYSSVKQQN